MARLWEHLSVNKQRLEEMATAGYTMATDVAEYLVFRGMPFRQAHGTVGKMVQYCLEQGKELHELSLEELQTFAANIEPDIYSYLDTASMIDRRTSQGGTASDNVRQALEKARTALAGEKK